MVLALTTRWMDFDKPCRSAIKIYRVVRLTGRRRAWNGNGVFRLRGLASCCRGLLSGFPHACTTRGVATCLEGGWTQSNGLASFFAKSVYRNKKLRYREEHSASVVLSWCTLWLYRETICWWLINHFYVIGHEATKFGEITQNNVHYAVQGHPRSWFWYQSKAHTQLPIGD